MQQPLYEHPPAFYRQQTALLQPQLTRLQRISSLLSWGRLATVIAIAVTIYQLTSGGSSIYFFAAGALIVLFLVLVYLHAGVEERQRFIRHLLQINEEEILYTEQQVLLHADGAAFADAQHPCSHDLDVFGKHSFFHHLNRTVTPGGAALLAGALTSYDKALIERRQQAVQELCTMPLWRQQFTAHAMGVAENPADMAALRQWLATDMPAQPLLVRVLMFLLPAALGGVLVAGSFADFDVWPPLTWLFLGNLFVTGLHGRHIRRQHALLGRVAPVLITRAAMLGVAEAATFKAPLLLEWQRTLVQPSAAAAVKALSGLLERFDKLFNIVAALVTNGLFQYHNHAYLKLLRWKQQFGPHTNAWLHTLSEFDAMNSMAAFAFNHPDFVYPVVQERQQMIQAESLGHPLIPAERRVCNTVSFSPVRFSILTGSNMAGKSTFLRTVGLSLVMANAGLPVCAARFEYYPFELFTSMRIDDSLNDSESYFYAELKRLRQLITRLGEGQSCFVLLDEVLRGTNSEDKYSGTVGLVYQLMQQGAWGILATHDIKVSLLEKEYPGVMSNMCFEAATVEGQLHFDYRLRPGVSAQKSATQLMLQMGIIPQSKPVME